MNIFLIIDLKFLLKNNLKDNQTQFIDFNKGVKGL